MITLFEEYKEFQGFKVGDILMSTYDGIIIHEISSSGRMLQTIHFMLDDVGDKLNFFNSSSYNYDELSRYKDNNDVEIINIIECIGRHPKEINFVNLVMKSNYKELIDVWKTYDELNQYIEMNKYNL